MANDTVLTRQDMRSIANPKAGQPISGIFKKHSGRALDSTNGFQQVHPQDAPGDCIAVSAGKDEQGNSVLWINTDKNSDVFRNWNNGKYDYSRIEGMAVTEKEVSPEAWSNLREVSGYAFNPKYIVNVRDVQPVEEPKQVEAESGKTSPQGQSKLRALVKRLPALLR